MNRYPAAMLIVLAVGSLYAAGSPAQAQSPAAGPIRACSLLPKEEVKRHLPWIDVLDQMPVEEEPIGASGSSCNYPTVFIQVLPFSQGTLDAIRAQDRTEPVDGIGDLAYLHNNRDEYAELYVKTGNHLLTLQANVDSTIEAVKPGVLALATALIEKLP